MASYTYGTRTTIRHEWRVPGATFGSHGAAVAELHKALAAAEIYYKDVHGADPYYDDWLRIYAADDDIILFFETDAPVHVCPPPVPYAAGTFTLPEVVTRANPDGRVITNVHATCYECGDSYAAGCSMYVTETDDTFRQICVDCHRAETHVTNALKDQHA